MSINHDDICFLIRLYHELSQIPEAIEQIELLSETYPSFSIDDFNLINAVIKEAIDPSRHTIRTLNSYYENEIEDSHLDQAQFLKEQKQKVSNEMLSICHRVLSIIENKLLPNTLGNSENRAYCYKLIGDLNRYIVESDEDSEKERALKCAENAYDISMQIGDTELPKCNPIKLNTILNYSVFLYEHMQKKDQAIELLQNSLTNDTPEIQTLNNKERYDQALNAFTTMKTNLSVWTSGGIHI